MAQTHIVMMTTVSSADHANKLASILVTAKAAACVQIMPIRSCYVWNGKVTNDDEYLLLIKTRANLYEPAAELIRQNHTYELPEIVSLPIATGSAPYLNWIDTVTGGKS